MNPQCIVQSFQSLVERSRMTLGVMLVAGLATNNFNTLVFVSWFSFERAKPTDL